jgi:hypothetical protein
VKNYHENTNAMDGYILDDGGNYLQPWGSFSPEFDYYNKF